MLVKHRQIVGIYLGQPAIETACISRGRRGRWTSDKGIPVHNKTGPVAEQVRQLLSKLKPSRKRLVTFAVPRDRIFFRELEFDGLTGDEAVSAVRMGIELHTHLGRNEIYFDVWELPPLVNGSDPEGGHKIRLLLAYVERAFLDPVLKVVRETGHYRSLGCISPLSCGIDGMLRAGGKELFPCTALSRQEDEIVISLHGPRGWEGSHSVSLYSEAGLAAALEEMSRLYPEPYRSLVKSPLYRIGEIYAPDLEPGPVEPCGSIGELSGICAGEEMSRGLCAAGIGLKPYPEISFQDKPRRKPFRIRINMFQVVAVLVAAGIISATVYGVVQNLRLSRESDALRKKIDLLEKRIMPLVEMNNKLEEVEKSKKELLQFADEYPDLLEVLKQIALFTPKDTWIRNFSLSNGKIRLSGEGKSATACVASLRKSRLFSQVKLVSSVTKVKNDMERFSVEIVPKLPDGGK